MNPQQIKKIINNGENDTVEFKNTFDKETVETVGALSNSSGGTILIGVNDSGVIQGIEIGKETLQNFINQIKQATNPQIVPEIEAVFIENKNIVLITVINFPIKPISVKGRFYKRVKNSNHLMNADKISEMHLKTYNKSWDYYPDTNHSIKDISVDKVKKVIGEINKRKGTQIIGEVENVLKKYELIKKGLITHAAYLLFHKSESVLTTIEAGRFSSETIIKDSISIRTNLFDEVDILLGFIQKHLNKGYIITGNAQREERWDYPLDAIRELVVHPVK